MLARLPRPFAILFSLLFLAASVWCLTTQPPPIRLAKKGGYTDVHLYHDITAAMVAGQPYHQAAAQLQRLHHYPLRPFVTMRLPTLAEMAALIGWHGVQILAYALVFIATFLWITALEGKAHWIERALVGFAVGTGGAMVSNRGLMAMHEYWGGFAIAIALAGVVGWPRRWWALVLPIAFGLAIRELTLPFALLAFAFAVLERRGSEALGWAGVILAFAAYMAWHAEQVALVARPGDLVSAGWHAAQGFSAFLKAVVYTSSLQSLPRPWALLCAMLPMLGWLSLSGRAAVFSALLIAGYVVVISAFSRPDTFYWGAIMLPWYFAGWGLIPRALVQLWGALGRPGETLLGKLPASL